MNTLSILFVPTSVSSLTLQRFLDQLGVLALAAEQDHPIIQHQVLNLWELVRQMR